jgi:hypothetical protein
VCHGGDSRLKQAFLLSSSGPDGATPVLVGGTAAVATGSIEQTAGGEWA